MPFGVWNDNSHAASFSGCPESLFMETLLLISPDTQGSAEGKGQVKI